MSKTKQHEVPGIEDLPEEILEQILALLSPYRDYKSCMLVCKLWHKIIQGVSQQEAANFHKALMTGAVNWSCKEPEYGATISERFLHSAVYYDKSIYVFGGCTSTSTTFNDLWRFDLTTRQWIRPLATGTYPSPKACCSLVEHNGMLILFGGWSHPTPYPLHQPARFFNQLHTYCPQTNRWTHIMTGTGCRSQIYPPGTAGHSASVVHNKMLIVGGSHNHGHSCIDIWELNLEDMSWTLRDAQGNKPLSRYGHSQIVIDDHHILIIGGCGGPNMQFNDVWMLTMETDAWFWKELTILDTQHSPPHLWFHSACKVADKVVVLSKLSHKSPRASDPPAASLKQIRLGNVWVPPKLGQKSHTSGNRQFAKRRLPETSESSSQESSSDNEDLVGACGGGPIFGKLAQNMQSDEPKAGPSGLGIAPPQASMPPRPGMPSIRPNSMRNRQKQLEALKRYEERIMVQMQQRAAAQKNKAVAVGGGSADDPEQNQHFVPSCMQRTANPMFVHVMDISKAITEGIVTWISMPMDATGEPPEETILYSLVYGRGEVIMFGGIQTDPNSMQMGMSIKPQVVSNDLHFITSQYQNLR